MKKSSKITAWIFYLLSLAALAYGFITHASLFATILRCVILLIIPWLICLIDCVKSNTKNKGLWMYFILTFGLIGIPSWLWRTEKVRKEKLRN